METPFYNYSWSQNPRPRHSSPKVISIPVHFIRSQKSDSESESSLALKIQKVFRAYLVRKGVKKILCIKRQVDEIEKKLLENETVELIRKDSKERIRINETLMSLLFKLDSISGVNSVVRECRKSVIKKAVALQEKIDQIVEMRNSAEFLVNSEKFEGENCESQGNEMKGNESDDNNLDLVNKLDQFLETEKSVDENLNFGVESKEHSINGNDFNSVSIECPFDCDSVNNKSDLQTENVVNDILDLTVESEGNNTLNANAFVGGLVECNKKLDLEDNLDGEDCVVKKIVEDVNVKGNGESLVEEENDDKKRNRELLEKMMVENQKMMSLMSQLCDRNEMQTKMLSCLTQRVEQLEKAFVCEKIRRKKKRNGV